MNKIKLLYDVVMKMKDKEVFKGTLKAEGIKDQVKKFCLNNEFEKDSSTGQTKAKINTEVNCDGKKVKHEGTTEFYSNDGCKHMHQGFMSHLHNLHKQNHFLKHESIGCSIKEKLTGIAFLLNVFNNIKVEEKEDKSFILSLKLSDIPEELKKSLHEKLSHNHEDICCNNKHFEAMKEFHNMKDHNVELTAIINKNYEVECISLDANGKQTGEDNATHDMSAKAELCLIW